MVCFKSRKWPRACLGRDKMAATLRALFSKNKLFPGVKLRKFVPKGPIDNKSSLVQLRAWRRTGAKPLPEPKTS